jgi:S1-C subfamily serine protease
VTENDADAYARPDGVEDGFAPRPAEPAYTPPPATVSPEERQVFGRPEGAEPFAPPPGQRIQPQSAPPQPVPPILAEAFGATPGASDGFDPAPGTRIAAAGPRPAPPWWKPDAASDPWRDPSAAFWLGRGAVFPGGRPEQLLPEDDQAEDDVPVPPDDVVEEQRPGGQGYGRVGLRAVLFLVVVGLLAGALGGGIGFWISERAKDRLHHPVSLATTGKPANRPAGSVADIAKRVGPAVVSISVTTANSFAVGSGVVIDKDGDVLTNNHVVAGATGGNATIVVTFASEATAKARIVGQDPASDLAVLKVPTDELTVASLGNSDQLAVGDPVIAIGSPLALQGTVTQGIVSALDRAVHISDESGGNGVYLDAIQTDAAINHGNSGGALVDASGAVVGINSAAVLDIPSGNGQSSSVSGIGFAIPINYARDIAQQLIRSGKAVHASMGVQGRTATANDGLEQGAYLGQIVDNGPADKAGLRPGDVIVVAGSKPIPSYDELVVAVQKSKPGAKLEVTYYRNSAKHTATVTLGKD